MKKLHILAIIIDIFHIKCSDSILNHDTIYAIFTRFFIEHNLQKSILFELTALARDNFFIFHSKFYGHYVKLVHFSGLERTSDLFIDNEHYNLNKNMKKTTHS